MQRRTPSPLTNGADRLSSPPTASRLFEAHLTIRDLDRSIAFESRSSSACASPGASPNAGQRSSGWAAPATRRRRRAGRADPAPRLGPAEGDAQARRAAEAGARPSLRLRLQIRARDASANQSLLTRPAHPRARRQGTSLLAGVAAALPAHPRPDYRSPQQTERQTVPEMGPRERSSSSAPVVSWSTTRTLAITRVRPRAPTRPHRPATTFVFEVAPASPNAGAHRRVCAFAQKASGRSRPGA